MSGTDSVQKHFVSATNVSQFAQPKKHHRQQCVRNNVSSFTTAFKNIPETGIFFHIFISIQAYISSKDKAKN